MLKGIFLGVSLAVTVTSFIFLATGMTDLLKENLITGAVIGVSDVVSYAIIGFVLGLVATLVLVVAIRKDAD